MWAALIFRGGRAHAQLRLDACHGGDFFFCFYFAEIPACVSHKAQKSDRKFAGAASSPSAAGENVTRKPHSNTKRGKLWTFFSFGNHLVSTCWIKILFSKSTDSVDISLIGEMSLGANNCPGDNFIPRATILEV
jgi:hypothetical protein